VGFLMHRDAVVCQGGAHWLFCASSSFLVLHVDAETDRVSSTKLRSPISSWRNHRNVQAAGSRLATTADGKLLWLCLYDLELLLVEIWTQPAAGRGQVWPRTRVIDLKPLMEEPHPVLCVWPGGSCGNGKLLITLPPDRGHISCQSYIANLQTGTMQELDSMSSSSIDRRVVCMEIDWTTFFMARLASKTSIAPGRQCADVMCRCCNDDNEETRRIDVQATDSDGYFPGEPFLLTG
jgi:hypothetical protein